MLSSKETAKQVFRDLGINGEAKKHSRSSKPASPFPFVLARDIVIEPKEFLIDGFLGLHEQSGWFGPPDSGKSSIVIHAACCVAADVLFCGRAVRSGPVLFVAAERGAVVRRRIMAWRKEHGIKAPALAVVDQPVDFRTGEIDAARIIATANKLTDTCGSPVIWIIFDTLNRIMSGGDENSSKDMGALIANIDRVYRATGAHCSLVHHVPVDRNDRMRGHGSLLGALDTTVRVTKTNNVVSVEADKANDLVDKPAFGFTFKSIHLDKTTTAPVAMPSNVTKVSGRSPRQFSDQVELARRALAEVICEHGENNISVPPGVKGVLRETWRQECYRRRIGGEEKSGLRQAFNRADSKLARCNAIGSRDGFVWLASS